MSIVRVLSRFQESRPALFKIDAGGRDVFPDPADQGFPVGERFFFPDLAQKAESDPSTVEGGLEVENVDFDMQAATTESRPVADIC